jgi:UDP-N-acetylmuramoylalanine--D-glutamate ligase
VINNLIKYFEGKKILILGFGKEGQSTYKLIRKYLKKQILYIADKEMNFQNNYEMLKDDSNLVFISGEKYLKDLKKYDIIMKTPGISFAGINTTKYLHKIKSQLELLLEFYNNFTIGVTGTKGKSTTSSLIYTVLREQNRKCMLLGNIGVPVFDYIDSIQEDILLVLEMSSHQLEYMKLSPNIAILLNVFQEHLDHYKSFENYVEAKSNIFKYQKQLDCLIYNYDNPILDKLVDNACGKVYKVSFKGKSSSNIYLKGNKIYYNEKLMYDASKEKRNLVGNYNLNNIMFVITVSEILKLDINKTIESINNFKTLEHRLEFVGKYNDILYYDNSIGTVPMATIEAVNALKNVDTLIIGGMNRGIDYGEFIEFLNNSNINNIICMPETGHNIAKEIKKDKRYIVDTLEEAVKVAKRVTQKEKICLLSPAAASYGFFKNFEEKGNLYKALVKE